MGEIPPFLVYHQGFVFILIVLLPSTLNVLSTVRAVQQYSLYTNANVIAYAGINSTVYFRRGYDSRLFGHTEWLQYLNTTENEWAITKISNVVSMTNQVEVPTLYILAENPWITWPLMYKSLFQGKETRILDPQIESVSLWF